MPAGGVVIDEIVLDSGRKPGAALSVMGATVSPPRSRRLYCRPRSLSSWSGSSVERSSAVAVAVVIDLEGVTAEQHDALVAAMGLTGQPASTVPGLIFHAAGPTPTG